MMNGDDSDVGNVRLPPKFSLRDILEYASKGSTRSEVNSTGTSISPKWYMRSQLGLPEKRSGSFQSFRRRVIRKRLQNLRVSWRHRVPFMPSNASGISAMSIDPVDNRYLLCGACNGDLSIVDLEQPLLKDTTKPVEHSVISGRSRGNHRYRVNCCQWFPQYTSSFLTSSTDKTMKLWDTNRFKVVDEYEFVGVPVYFHWCPSPSYRCLIAVASMSSNIDLIDPRAGDSMQNLRWKSEGISSVQWSAEHDNFLLSGGKNGSLFLWDVRSTRSPLKILQSGQDNAHSTCVSGIRFSDDGLYAVSISYDQVIRVWRTHTMESTSTIKLPARQSQMKDILTIHFDVFCDDGVLRACIPLDDQILLLSLDANIEETRSLLVGHFHTVNACLYRKSFNQVISSSNDRMVLIWSPAMDEELPDQKSVVVHSLQEDEWSDED
ncbi:hypothetical protein AB6A40_001933 [Gnathostoma spinigerum]|uniref:DNA excision repair protein ERCC-8 n=1 Tax=Gnathostoma spinigerum TaxID=75299 RepID=A0ABD6E5D1_9BILA